MAKTTLVAMVILLALNENYIECTMMNCQTVTYAKTELDVFVAQCAPAAWKDFFVKEEVQKDVQEISVVMTKEAKKAYFEPRMPLMFKALDMVAPNQVKVVILGQDPTPQQDKATGLAFSVDNPKTVGTVLNVLLEAALEGWPVNINNGNLESWANQGVLLLNTAFTCQQNKKGSHLSWWYQFSEYLIKYISYNAQPSVWLLWGNEAQYYQKFIDNTKHYIITGGHPSSLGGIGENTFFGGNYFNCANTFLAKKARGQIDWGLALQNVLNPCPPEPVASPMGSPKMTKKQKQFRRSDKFGQ